MTWEAVAWALAICTVAHIAVEVAARAGARVLMGIVERAADED